MPNDENFHLEYNLAALVAHQVTFNRLLRGESNLRPPWYTSVKKKLGIRRVKPHILEVVDGEPLYQVLLVEFRHVPGVETNSP